MSTAEKRRIAGQLVVGGFQGHTVPDEFHDRLVRGEVAGAILFKRNIDSLEQTAALASEILEAAPSRGPAPFVSIDQEGGPVARLRGLATDLPAMATLGAHRDAQLCAEVGEMVGRELAALGFNVDFAPVLDVASNPDNPVIGKRSFSHHPQEVAELATAFALGMQLSGVVPCVKHFPGHGDTDVDSHLDLPVLNCDRRRLEAVELVPFQAAIAAGLPLLMTGHLLLPELDLDHPATLSRNILSDLLRGELGYEGVIVSDDLEMGAIEKHYDVESFVTLGVDAGLDIFLICHSAEKQQQAVSTLIKLLERGGEPAERIEASAARVRRLRQRFPSARSRVGEDWRAVVGSAEHLALAQRVSG